MRFITKSCMAITHPAVSFSQSYKDSGQPISSFAFTKFAFYCMPQSFISLFVFSLSSTANWLSACQVRTTQENVPFPLYRPGFSGCDKSGLPTTLPDNIHAFFVASIVSISVSLYTSPDNLLMTVAVFQANRHFGPKLHCCTHLAFHN